MKVSQCCRRPQSKVARGASPAMQACFFWLSWLCCSQLAPTMLVLGMGSRKPEASEHTEHSTHMHINCARACAKKVAGVLLLACCCWLQRGMLMLVKSMCCTTAAMGFELLKCCYQSPSKASGAHVTFATPYAAACVMAILPELHPHNSCNKHNQALRP